MKKLLSLVLSLLIIISVLPFSIFAIDTVPKEDMQITDLLQSAEVCGQGEVSGKCGDNLTWSYDTETCVLTISGAGDMYDFTTKSELKSGSFYYYSTAPWGYSYAPYIKSVVICDSVTSLGSSAFDSCTALESITVPDNLTSIGDNTFYYCTSLTSLTIPNSVTSIGESAFYGCNSLNFNTYDNAKYLGNSNNPYLYLAKATSASITEVDINENTRFIGESAFMDCVALTSITIPNSVSNIACTAFSGCSSLEFITIPNSVTSIGGAAFYCCSSLESITIPSGVTSIESSLFTACSSLRYVKIPDSVIKTDNYAFSGCSSLTSIKIPVSVTSIGIYAFDINCKIYYAGSTEEWKCVSGHSIANSIVFNHTEHKIVTDKGYPATCTVKGLTDGSHCEACNEILLEQKVTEPLQHNFSEWKIVQNGNELSYERSCERCKEKESEKYSSLDEFFKASNDNYTVCIKHADFITAIRYAKGNYTASGDIKRALDCVTISGNDINNSENNTFVRELSDGGDYSFFIKSEYGEFITHLSLTHMSQTLSSYDNVLTVKNLYGVSNLLFATGYCKNGSEVKANLVYSVASKKIAGAKNYSYAMPSGGEASVLVKYEDLNRPAEILHINLKTPNPIITQNGLDMTIDGLTDVKSIRRAYGTYATLAQIKSAEAVVTYNGKKLTGGADTAKIHVPREGTVTLCIQYKSGYTALKTIEVVQKRPTFVQNGNKITIGNLDDLYVVRYAKGTYTKANAIKAASGSKFIRSSAINENTEIVIDNLDPGTYTFLVQFNDQSQNFYTIVID